MQRQIIVSADEYEVRIAVVEHSRLAEYFFERRDQQRIVGNVYKGTVTSIIPGIEAAFIDIGLNRNAFLYVNDLYPSMDDFGFLSDEEERLEGNGDGNGMTHLTPPDIRDLLHENQQILVQLYKEPIGAKGSRVTTNVSLPGRYLVLLPCLNHIGVSRRIEEEEVREELKQQVQKLLPEGMGAIIRTAGRDVSDDAFRNDIEFLMREWNEISKQSEHADSPSLIYQSPGPLFLLIRDLISEGIDEIVIDDAEMYSDVIEFVKREAPQSVYKITYYDDSIPVYRSYGLESEIQNLRNRKVWLKNGGYIVIEETEAMTVIDVNTGRYLGKHNLEETVYKTNMESATEIARQLRLRDIGGIIIIDFIDMREKEHQVDLMNHLVEQLRKDRSRTHVYPLTDLGLLQMTRKRVRKSLTKALTQPCPYCKRDGYISSLDTMMISALRTFEEICKEEEARKVTLKVHPRVADKLLEDKQTQITLLEQRYNASLRIVSSSEMHFEQIAEEIS